MTVMIDVRNVCKQFILHNQGGAVIPVLQNVNLQVHAGECVALYGHSGSGKSTLLRALYANYKPSAGAIYIRHKNVMEDIASASPRDVLAVRRETVGYVSQFLRVIPRVSALDIVATANREVTKDAHGAREIAQRLLQRMNISRRLWQLAPATFSGGEQQRINIARGFSVPYPILLLDEPTASLDADNRRVVVDLIAEAKSYGTAVVGIFHDDAVREAVADRVFHMSAMGGLA